MQRALDDENKSSILYLKKRDYMCMGLKPGNFIKNVKEPSKPQSFWFWCFSLWINIHPDSYACSYGLTAHRLSSLFAVHYYYHIQLVKLFSDHITKITYHKRIIIKLKQHSTDHKKSMNLMAHHKKKKKMKTKQQIFVLLLFYEMKENITIKYIRQIISCLPL